MAFYMDLFSKAQDMNLYYLSGVEDYLTDGAKKHRRNLVYSTFVIFVLSVMNFTDVVKVKEFATVFGFKLAGDDTHGIPFTIVIGMLLVVCAWETLMLFSYKRACDAQWHGRLMTTMKGKNGAKTAPSLIREQNDYRIVFQSADEVAKKIDKHSAELTSHFTKQLESILRHTQCPSVMSSKAEFEQLKNQILNSKIAEIEAGELRKIIDERIERISARNIQITELIDKEVKEMSQQAAENNEEWKICIEHQFERHSRLQKQTLEHLSVIARHKHQSQFIEFYLPVLLGAVGTLLGLVQVFNLL